MACMLLSFRKVVNQGLEAIMKKRFVQRVSTTFVALTLFSGLAVAYPIIDDSGGPFQISAGEDLHLWAIAHDTSDLPLQYTWVLPHAGNWTSSSGAFTLTWATLNAAWFINSFKYNEPVDVNLIVENSNHETASSTTQWTIYEANPVAAFSLTPLSISVGDSLTLDGSPSSSPDPRKQIVQWRWDINPVDTSPFGWYGWDVDFTAESLLLTPEQSELFFPSPGTYNIGLRVFDNYGGVSAVMRQLTVNSESQVPEPSTLILFLGGMAVLTFSCSGRKGNLCRKSLGGFRATRKLVSMSGLDRAVREAECRLCV